MEEPKLGGRLSLPGGGWAELIDPRKLTEGQRRPVRIKTMTMSADGRQAAMEAEQQNYESEEAKRDAIALVAASTMTADDLNTLAEINDLMACAVIVAWELVPGPTPVAPPSPADLLALDGATYDALQNAASEYMPFFMGVDFEATPAAALDDNSPTVPSNA